MIRLRTLTTSIDFLQGGIILNSSTPQLLISSSPQPPRALIVNIGVPAQLSRLPDSLADKGPNKSETSPNMKLATEWVDVLISPILIIFTAPYRRTFKLYTWEPLKRIREAENDRKVFISRVREWKEEKYKELESVQLAVRT